MATWVTGEVPAAAKLQTLDDRVTSLETSRVTLPGGTQIICGTVSAFTTTSAGRNTLTNPLGHSAIFVGITVLNSTDSNTTQLSATLLSNASSALVFRFVTAAGALAVSLACNGYVYCVIG